MIGYKKTTITNKKARAIALRITREKGAVKKSAKRMKKPLSHASRDPATYPKVRITEFSTEKTCYTWEWYAGYAAEKKADSARRTVYQVIACLEAAIVDGNTTPAVLNGI